MNKIVNTLEEHKYLRIGITFALYYIVFITAGYSPITWQYWVIAASLLTLSVVTRLDGFSSAQDIFDKKFFNVIKKQMIKKIKEAEVQK